MSSVSYTLYISRNEFSKAARKKKKNLKGELIKLTFVRGKIKGFGKQAITISASLNLGYMKLLENDRNGR